MIVDFPDFKVVLSNKDS